MSNEVEVLLGRESQPTEVDELQAVIAEAKERGFVTIETLASLSEESDISREQIQELHGYLDEHGIEVLGADEVVSDAPVETRVESGGRSAMSPPWRGRRACRRCAVAWRRLGAQTWISAWSPAWTPCVCICARSGACRC